MATAPKTAATAANPQSAAKPAGGRLEVPEMRIGRMRLTLFGDTPLVCHRFDEKATQMILDKQMGKAAVGREYKKPAEDFFRAFYVLPGTVPLLHDEDENNVWAEGRFGFPAIGLKAAAVRAATDVGLKMTDMRRAFHIDGDLVEIKSEQHPQMRMDMVRIGMGTADVRFRPEFRDWSADVPIRFNEAVISVEQIVNLFNLAGFGVGIGEWRPEKDGQWGMFHVGGRVEVEG